MRTEYRKIISADGTIKENILVCVVRFTAAPGPIVAVMVAKDHPKKIVR